MTKNRFEQVDEVQPDAITLTLAKGDEAPTGTVVCPAACSHGRLAEDTTSPAMPAQDAYRSAIRLANEVKAAIVVMDPDGVWNGEWGALYRAAD
jgi:hypothetical protein